MTQVNDSKPTFTEIVIGLTSTGITLAFIIAIAVSQIAVALNLNLIQNYADEATWAANIIWVIIAGGCWVLYLTKKIGVAPTLTFTIITLAVITGKFISEIYFLTIWINVVLSVVIALSVKDDCLRMWQQTFSRA